MRTEQKILKSIIIVIFVCLFVLDLAVGLFCSAAGASENSLEADDLAKIDSGFFVSGNDVNGLRDRGFREKLRVFLMEKAILTRSAKGLTYYYISEDAIAQIEDLELRNRVRQFVTEGLEKEIYVVQPGDSLWKIATKYGISVEELARVNRITVSGAVYPGQKLVITSTH